MEENSQQPMPKGAASWILRMRTQRLPAGHALRIGTIRAPYQGLCRDAPSKQRLPAAHPSDLLLDQFPPGAAEELLDKVGGVNAAPEIGALHDGLQEGGRGLDARSEKLV